MKTPFVLLLIQLALTKTVPLLLAAMGGLFSERTGVVNIALEGMMLIGAFAAVLGSYYSGNPWLGLLLAGLAGALVALILAFASVQLLADQIVTGIAINILALGITGFGLFRGFSVHGSSPSVTKLPQLGPLLGKTLPGNSIIGTIFGRQSPLLLLALLIVLFSHFLLYYTPLGLRMRAVGEDPAAADSLGVNVVSIRYFGVIISGILSGLAGAYLSLADLSQFVERMTGGRGFIALAALIFGNWKPAGVISACFFFGFFEAVAESLQGYFPQLHEQFFFMLPFVITIVVLAGVVGTPTPPAADGKPYQRQ